MQTLQSIDFARGSSGAKQGQRAVVGPTHGPPLSPDLTSRENYRTSVYAEGNQYRSLEKLERPLSEDGRQIELFQPCEWLPTQLSEECCLCCEKKTHTYVLNSLSLRSLT